MSDATILEGIAQQAPVGEEQVKMVYEGIPTESIMLTPEKSDIYPDMGPLPDNEVMMKELTPFLLKTFYKARESGHLARTVKHYTAELEAGGALDAPMMATMKKYANELWENRHDDAKVTILNKAIRELVGSFKLVKKEK